ncbi:complement C1q subcomponent subunit A [Mixophyes fleayi]|uniref:complement C1q subcomponent subunit A n=1 Tax=Mixophyes fleayi TaxID=3061075 RepID=UPI003F4DA592
MRICWLLLALLLAENLSWVWCQSDGCTAAKGLDGHPGRPGRDGRPGQKGDRGDPGAAGRILGLTTSKGDAGDPGATGEPGHIGYKGPEGPLGSLGEQGRKGLKGAMADMKEQHRPVFSATLPKIKDNVLIFSQVITSEGNIYDSSTGKFTCTTEPGHYYFTFQVMSIGDLCLHIYVKRGAEQKKKLLSFCDKNVRNQPQVNSGGTVLNLGLKDQVWIETDATSRRIAGSEGSSVFSGFLLFPRNE